MPKHLTTSILFSLILLNSCGAQNVEQAVQVDSPKNTNSNNQTDQSQNNSGSGVQNNTTIAPTKTEEGTQAVNNNSGSGTLINPVNSSNGEQTSIINTGTGSQTVVQGNQDNSTTNTNTINDNSANTTINSNNVITDNSTTNNTTINILPPTNAKVTLNNSANVADGITISWNASEGASSYKIYSKGTLIQETNETSFNTKDLSFNSLEVNEISIVAVSQSNSTTSSPVPVSTNDISVVEVTTFNGKVFDDLLASMDGVVVTAKSLNSQVPFEATSTTAGGSYVFNNAPAGIQIEITARKSGYTTRKRVEVLKSNKQGDPNANRYDFGVGLSGTNYGDIANALSDKPEVSMVSPGRRASGTSPGTNFTLTFSEPMDRQSVVDNFEVRTFTSEALSVDAQQTVTGSGSIADPSGTRIWDKAAFNAIWNGDDTQVTFSFREDRRLPSDKDTDKIPDYQVSFKRQSGVIRDKAGIPRYEKYFKLTDGDFEESYKFSISSDETLPTLSTLVAQTNENGGVNGDAIKITFSEPMIYYTLGPAIAGGMNGISQQAAAAHNGISATDAAANYIVTVTSPDGSFGPVSWASLGGRAVFDTNDPTHKSVLLLPPSGQELYTPGAGVEVTVYSSILDPAGNNLNPNNSTMFINAN